MTHDLRLPQNRYFEEVITLKDGDEPYMLITGEKIILGVKQCGKKSVYLLKKELAYSQASGGYPMILTTAETSLPEGVYCYDVALCRNSGELEPLIDQSKLEIVRSVVLEV